MLGNQAIRCHEKSPSEESPDSLPQAESMAQDKAARLGLVRLGSKIRRTFMTFLH